MTQSYKTPAYEIEIEQIVLEELPVEQKKIPFTLKEQKPVKKALLKLLKKGKYNAKYLEELVSPDAAKRNVHYRNYGYF